MLSEAEASEAEMRAETEGHPPNIVTDEPWYCEVLSFNNNQAILRTYSVLIKQNIIGQIINYSYPANPYSLNSAFSLYTIDPTAIGLKESKGNIESFNIYPNPNNGNFTIGINVNTYNNCEINITDIMGSIIYSNSNLKLTEGVNKIPVVTCNLQSGIYFVTLKCAEHKSFTKKIVIN